MRTPTSPPSSKFPVFDPHEKPDRYKFKPKRQGIIGRMKESWMTQSQRTRWIKTAAIVFAIVTLFYFISPKGVEVYHEVTHPAQGNNGQSPSDSSYGTERCT
ncbi:guanosine-diphosphatase, partial [Fusarium oxysporum f. sp. lycopersici 4287]